MLQSQASVTWKASNLAERDVSYSAPFKTFTRGVWAPPAGRTLTTLARNHLIPNPVPINQAIGIQC